MDLSLGVPLLTLSLLTASVLTSPRSSYICAAPVPISHPPDYEFTVQGTSLDPQPSFSAHIYPTDSRSVRVELSRAGVDRADCSSAVRVGSEHALHDSSHSYLSHGDRSH